MNTITRKHVKNKTIKLREALSVGGVGKVDRDRAVIHDVKVCGVASKNGRRYDAQALRKAAPLYEGARVFFDHPEGDSNTRRFRERFGRLVNVRADAENGLIADLKYNPAHAEAEQFLWLAENDPSGMGMSHNAEGNGIRESDGSVLVKEITKVHSVDLVDGPATTLSLFEQDSSMDPLTDPGAPADPGAGDAAGGGGDIDSKLSALAADMAAHPNWDKATKIAKLKALIDLMEDDAEDEAQAEPEGDEGAEGDEPAEPAEDEMMEQLGRFKSPAVKAARKRLLREQRRKHAVSKGISAEAITETFLEQLCDAPAKKLDRLIEDRRQLLAVATAEKPRTAPAGGGRSLTPAEIAAKVFAD